MTDPFHDRNGGALNRLEWGVGGRQDRSRPLSEEPLLGRQLPVRFTDDRGGDCLRRGHPHAQLGPYGSSTKAMLSAKA